MTINEFFESARLIVPEKLHLSVSVEMERHSNGNISIEFIIYVGEKEAIHINAESPESALSQLRKAYDCNNESLSGGFIIS